MLIFIHYSIMTFRPNPIITLRNRFCGWHANWSVTQISNSLPCPPCCRQKLKWTRNGKFKSRKICRKPNKRHCPKRMKICRSSVWFTFFFLDSRVYDMIGGGRVVGASRKKMWLVVTVRTEKEESVCEMMRSWEKKTNAKFNVFVVENMFQFIVCFFFFLN